MNPGGSDKAVTPSRRAWAWLLKLGVAMVRPERDRPTRVRILTPSLPAEWDRRVQSVVATTA